MSNPRLALRFFVLAVGSKRCIVAALYPFSVMKTDVVYSKKYLSIGAERHMGRSAPIIN